MIVYAPIVSCRLCRHEGFDPVLDLGKSFLPRFLDPGAFPSHRYNAAVAPLELVRCSNCQLVQLRHTVPAEDLYGDNYPYRSGANKTMRLHLEELAGAAAKEAGLHPGDIAVDIGSNDGTLLAALPPGLMRLGFDPAREATVSALAAGIPAKAEAFSAPGYFSVFSKKAMLVMAIAMFYDLADPGHFCYELSQLLDDSGVAVIQMNDLLSMVENTAFDMINHEHLCLHTLHTLRLCLERQKVWWGGSRLEVFRVERFPLNGGTMRAWIARGREIEPSVGELLEREMFILDQAGLDGFKKRALDSAKRLSVLVHKERDRGGHVYAYGASTRGKTILQAAALRYPAIEGVADIDPAKIGKRMSGLNIPVVTEAEARAKASLLLVLPYSYREEFLERERDFMKKGGRLLFPLPGLEVVGG